MKALKLIADLSLGRLIVLAAILTTAYFFTYFDDGTVLEAQIASTASQVSTESARRVGIEKTMKKEEEMRGNLLQLERNLEVVKAKIPNEFKDTQMSAIINVASEVSKVTVLELGVRPNEVRAKPVSANKSSIRPEDLIDEVSFNIVLAGTYDGFLKFLDVLTKEDKVIKIRNFTIEKGSASIDDDSIKFKGEIVGFKQAVITFAQDVK